MRKLIVVTILVSCSCVAIMAQQKEKSDSSPAASLPSSTPAPDARRAVSTFQLPPLDFTSGRSQTASSASGPSSEPAKDENPFVVLHGAVYMRLPGGNFLVPVPGGGASGCFSLDLPQRIKALREVVPKLKSLDQNF